MDKPCFITPPFDSGFNNQPKIVIISDFHVNKSNYYKFRFNLL
jgi:hypothetical protein